MYVLNEVVWLPLKVAIVGRRLPCERKAVARAIVVGMGVSPVRSRRGDVRFISIQGHAGGVSLEPECLRCMNTYCRSVDRTCREMRGRRHVLMAHSVREWTSNIRMRVRD